MALGLSREVYFYHNDGHLYEKLTGIVPRIYYAFTDVKTGGKYILMEDLGDLGGLQAGLLFGPGNPNNWTKAKSGELATISEKWFAQDPWNSVENLCRTIFHNTAILHATFWGDRSICSLAWLRSSCFYRDVQQDSIDSSILQRFEESISPARDHWFTAISSKVVCRLVLQFI